MIGTYKLYEKETAPSEEELNTMAEDDLLELFEQRITISPDPRQREGCINCDSRNWYKWGTRDALERTYWFCTDCYQAKVKAATG